MDSGRTRDSHSVSIDDTRTNGDSHGKKDTRFYSKPEAYAGETIRLSGISKQGPKIDLGW